MHDRLDTDVVVVGAGLSGLTAARRLEAAGIRALVLEGRTQVGGRAHSRDVGGVSANLGGEWVGAQHRRMRRVAAELGLELAPTRFMGSPIRWRTERYDSTSRVPPFTRGDWLTLARVLWKAGRLARQLSPETPWTPVGSGALDRVSLGAWLREQDVGDDVYDTMDAFLGDLVSMPIDQLSLLHALWWVRRNDGPVRAFRSAFETRIVDGAGELASRLASRLAERVELNAVVTAIEQQSSMVAVQLASGREIRARRAVLAFPTTRLPDVEFDAPLDPEIERLAEDLRIGPATKVVAKLTSAARDLPRVVMGGDSITAAWRYGQQVSGFSRPPHDRLPDGALVGELARAFFRRPADLEQVVIKRWAEAAHIGGCDVGFEPGQLSELGPLLRRDHGLIHFAGPERSSWPNNMEGALESGEHAADRARRALALH